MMFAGSPSTAGPSRRAGRGVARSVCRRRAGRPARWAALAAAVLALSGCEGWDRDIRLTVRTTLPEGLAAEVEEAFEEAHPTIDVRYTRADEQASLAELRAGPDQPAFDVWWGASGLVLERAAAADLLRPASPSWADGEEARSWHPRLTTPFVIAFNREALELARAPTDWVDLFHFRWAEEVWVLDPESTVEGGYFAGAIIVEALRDDDDLGRGFDWLRRLHTQVGGYVDTSGAVIRALGSGDARLGIVPRAAADSARSAGADWVHHRFPQSGTPVLTRGVAVVGGTPRYAAAEAFVDFLGEGWIFEAESESTGWDPVSGSGERPGPSRPGAAGASSGYPPALDTLAAELAGWIDRWSLEVAGR